MVDTITIYWACIENEWMRATAPESVASLFYKERKYDKNQPDVNMHHCPAFNLHMENMFALRSIYSYKFGIRDGVVGSHDYDQTFFERHVNTKSIEQKLFSFQQSFIFFTEKDSLPVTMSLSPYFEDNNITDRCIVIPGELDIGKWFRNTDLAFYLKRNYNEFCIEEGEIYCYMKFHTDKKINFIQYRQTEKLNLMLVDILRSKNNKKKVFSMEKFYSMFRTKKIILEEIKKNIIGE
jgi:hypothetical protein